MQKGIPDNQYKRAKRNVKENSIQQVSYPGEADVLVSEDALNITKRNDQCRRFNEERKI